MDMNDMEHRNGTVGLQAEPAAQFKQCKIKISGPRMFMQACQCHHRANQFSAIKNFAAGLYIRILPFESNFHNPKLAQKLLRPLMIIKQAQDCPHSSSFQSFAANRMHSRNPGQRNFAQRLSKTYTPQRWLNGLSWRCLVGRGARPGLWNRLALRKA